MKETFVSAFGHKTKEEAEKILEDIRIEYPESSGWKEISSYTELHSDGWHAIRVLEHN